MTFLVLFWFSRFYSLSPDTPLEILLLLRAGKDPPKDLQGPGCPILFDPLIPGRYLRGKLIHPVVYGTGNLLPISLMIRLAPQHLSVVFFYRGIP